VPLPTRALIKFFPDGTNFVHKDLRNSDLKVSRFLCSPWWGDWGEWGEKLGPLEELGPSIQPRSKAKTCLLFLPLLMCCFGL
jgi:hypothetical protein